MKKVLLSMGVSMVLSIGIISESWAACTDTYYYTDGTMTYDSQNTNKILDHYVRDCGTSKSETYYKAGENNEMRYMVTYQCQSSVCSQTGYYVQEYNSAGKMTKQEAYTSCNNNLCVSDYDIVYQYDETGTKVLNDKVFKCNNGACSQSSYTVYEYNNSDYPDKRTSRKVYKCSEGVCTLDYEWKSAYNAQGKLVEEAKFECSEGVCVHTANSWSGDTSPYHADSRTADADYSGFSVCTQGYFNQSGTCVTECGDGYTPDNATGICVEDSSPAEDEGNDLSGATNQASSDDINPTDADCPDGKLSYKGECYDEYPFAKKHWTPGEADPWLYDDNNTVTLIFKM